MSRCVRARETYLLAASGEELPAELAAHAPGCPDCTVALGRAARFTAALDEAAGELATGQMPLNMLAGLGEERPKRPRLPLAAIGGLAAVLVVAVVAVGMWQRLDLTGGPGQSPSARPTPAAVDPDRAMLNITCDGPVAFPVRLLEGDATAEQGDHPAAAPLRQLVASPDASDMLPPTGWHLVIDEDDLAMFVAASLSDREPPLAEAIFERVDGTWRTAGFGDCWPMADVGPDLGRATFRVAPGVRLAPETTDLDVLVTELACNSGQDATGRIAKPAIIERDRSVVVVFGVVPRAGNHECPSNPETPFHLVLGSPLGQRTLLDGLEIPPRDATTCPARYAPCPTDVPSPTPTATAVPTPTPTPTEPLGTLPDELIGRGFVAQGGDEGTEWIAGALGGPIVRLPAGETGLDADGVRILSVTGDVGTQEIIIRSYPSGEEVLRVPVTEPVEYGVLRGDLVYWSGSAHEMFIGVPAGTHRDGGVWRMALPTGTPEALILPGLLQEGVVGRGNPVLSPSGQTVGSLLCRLDSVEGGPCIAEIMDLETRKLHTLSKDGSLSNLTDAVAVRTGFMQPLEGRTFDETVLWRFPVDPPSNTGAIPEFVIDYGYLTADARTLIQGFRPPISDTGIGHFDVVAIDIATGAQRLIARDPFGQVDQSLHVVPELSSDRFAALLADVYLSQAWETGVPVRLLDLETGQLLPGAFPLDWPR